MISVINTTDMNDVSFMISGDAMKIITCYKCVPDEQDIAVNNADGSLDFSGNDSNLLIVFYVQIMPDDFVMQLHRF